MRMVDEAGGGPGRRKLLVIGNGMAGARAVEEVLERDRGRFEIAMIGDEPYGNYNRISLSNVLAGSEEPQEIFLNPLDWYDENGITLHSGARAVAIDRAARVVHTADGARHPYDELVIATGSRAFVPPIDGAFAGDALRPGVFAFRSMDDCDRMLAWAESARRVVVVGGGLLGLEAARGLQERGLEATVVERAPHLMSVQLDAEAAAILQRSVEDLGIAVHLGATSTAVLGDDRVEGLQLADGTTLASDMVVFAAGIRANTELAVEAGLPVERAILVDDALRVQGEESIWAVGECVQHRGQVYGLVAPLWEQAGVLADRLTGVNPRAEYHGSRLVTKLKVSGVELATMGVTAPERPDDEVVRFAEPRRSVYKTLVVRDGRLVGATLIGDLGRISSLTQAFDQGTVLPEQRVSLLFDVGGPSEEVGAADLPEEAQVCNCNGVTKGQIRACVAAGKRTMREVAAHTRAGTGCGSCKAQVLDIVEWAAGGELEPDPAADWYVPSIPMTKPQLMAAVRERGITSVSGVVAAFAETEDPKAKPALASLMRLVWGADYDDERDARFINDRVHGNIQRDGTFSVVPRISGGVTNAAQLRRIADVADKYEVPMIKITGGQRIDLLGVPKERLPDVWRDLDMPSGYAYGKSFRTVKTCVGSDFCRFGLADSTKLGIDLEERYKGLESPAKLKLGVAGCPRNCSEAMVKDVGFVAVEGGRWEMYVGGAAGAHVRKGDVLCTVDTHEEAIAMAGRFMQYYRENAKWLERTYSFVPRVGVEEIRAVVVEDRDGDAARLDAAIQAAVDAFRDPWLEAAAPKTPNQFASVVEASS